VLLKLLYRRRHFMLFQTRAERPVMPNSIAGGIAVAC